MRYSAAIFISTFLVCASASSTQVPSCDNKVVGNMAVELINKQVRENPIAAAMANGIRAVSLAPGYQELHADEVIRACIATVKRNNAGEGAVGYTIELGDRQKGEVWVHIYGVDQIQSMFPRQDPAKSDYEQCIEDADGNLNGNMVALISCAEKELMRQDARLNAAYKVALAASKNKDALRQQQRQWVKDRNKTCKDDPNGGPDVALEARECLLQQTEKRAQELESITK